MIGPLFTPGRSMMVRTPHWLVAALLAVSLVSAPASAQQDDAWTALAEGRAVLLMRHALAPGIGDPASFDADDCSTQRNLSDVGRDQARRIGEALRTRLGDAPVASYSSVWCRCRETAELLGVGEVTTLPALNSFFADRATRDAQTEALAQWIAERVDSGAPSAVLVTHQVNIAALTGGFTRSGESVIVDGDARILLSVELASP